MLASRSRAGTLSRSRLPYVCPACQSTALLAAFLLSSRHERRDCRQRRSFTSVDRRSASVVTSQLSPDRANSAIRNHLRAWAVKNQKKKQQEAENAEGDSNKLKRLAALPNSLFIEEASSTDDTLVDDEAAAGDDLVEPWEDGVQAGWHETYAPGDVIWWRPGRHTTFAKPQLALYLGALGWQRQYMLGDGRWVVEKARGQASPAFKNFASKKEVDQIRQHLPVKPLETSKNDYDMPLGYSFAGDLPAAAAEPLMERFAQLAEAMSTWRRENLALLDSLYDRIADEERYIALQFPEVVTKFLGVDYDKVPPAALLTIFRTLQRKLVSVVAIRKQTYYPSATVTFTPKRLARSFDQVCEWAREYQEAAADAAMGKNVAAALESNPLSAFVAKARRIILKSRALRSPTTIGSLGPSSIQGGIIDGKVARQDNEEVFTENDRMFIAFLWDCYIRYPFPDNNRNMAIASLLLRAVGAYPKLRLDANMGRLLLQELGILPPWFLQSDHNITLELPHGRAGPELKRVFNEASEFCEDSGIASTLDPHVLGDSMASLRQDLGDLPVYCIDTGEAVVREDGFSIEPNPEIPGTYWLHGHTAHPTAFIGPDHVMAQRARMLTQGIFHHGRLARMLPDKFCYALSLRSGAPALTVSTLLTEEGNVLDIRVRPTTLRNVIFLSDPAVEHVLDKPKYEAATISLGFKGAVNFESLQQAKPADVDTVKKYLPDIQLLEKLLLAREERRKQEVAVVPDWEIQGSLSSMSYAYIFGSQYDEDDLFRSRQYQGDPAMRIKVSRYMRINRVSEMGKYVTVTALLGDLMSESAAKWFSDRNMPAVFFGSSYAPDYPPERLNNLKRGENADFPMGKFSTTAIEHVHKNHKSHLWVSNPLRRYPDLMALWNVDSYLRAEAAGLVGPGQSADKLDLPITREMCEDFIATAGPKMYQWAVQLSRTERLHWVIQALFRAFHFKELELPEVWDLHVSSVVPNKIRPDDSGLRGVLLPFQVFAVVLASKEGWEKGAKKRSFLPVKLELVDIDKQMLVVRVVGPPSDDYTQRGPIDLAPKQDESQEDGELADQLVRPDKPSYKEFNYVKDSASPAAV
ncbi:hypothetical protein A1O7_02001 [Cladophialophora yegresii CBS 114405]|uniref:RNB domain-containing protein n=1 Tax=Cladophialophora yegresii CBS 114405 TaxID=1182544 RepID=W9W0V4_9EURO|nr:uncharacterized protein A1O7_02001 [Cladophialophora yegresii CBS 114405]EXJ61573.1 hypothetical protein A1O7_02001 [Cladophialophora yegresii CBS 114405]